MPEKVRRCRLIYVATATYKAVTRYFKADFRRLLCLDLSELKAFKSRQIWEPGKSLGIQSKENERKEKCERKSRNIIFYGSIEL